MRKIFVIFLIAMLVSSLSYAANFTPTMLKLTADPIIQYDFSGSDLTIPVQVSGTTALVNFLVFTRNQASKIPFTQNGNMGWHQVCRIDTCIYYSTPKGFNVGKNTITWNGKDQDGGVVPAGEYTYYLWAFDNIGAKVLVSKYVDGFICHDYGNQIQEFDEKGLPIANPIIYKGYNAYTGKRVPFRWKIGNDPLDATLLETATVPLAEGWAYFGDFAMYPTDFNYFYAHMRNMTSKTAGNQKFKWVPSGACELQTNWGNEGWSDLFTHKGGGDQGPGVHTDGVYTYAFDEAHYASTEPTSALFVYDMDGALLKEVDLTPWWSNANDFEAGAQMNGGPINATIRKTMMVLNSHATCINNMVDPQGYMESGDKEDFLKWANGNGDYTLDHNFEETAKFRWACNDYNTGPYKTSVATDANLFTAVNAYDIGVVSFGLYAPDGTGLGYYLFAGDTAGLKGGTMIVDSGTPFDGMYTDNQQSGGTRFEFSSAKADSGIFYIGHDTISGVITNAVGVKESAPAAFSVAQNSPNPFNPNTTINFTIAEAGNVSVEVYNVAGQKVDTLADGFLDAGKHSVVWDASGFSAGVYFYTVKACGFSKTMKMTLLK